MSPELYSYLLQFNPDVANIMSYSFFPSDPANPYPPCTTHFAEGQFDRMYAHIEVLPELGLVLERSEDILFPNGGDPVFVGEDVAIRWKQDVTWDFADPGQLIIDSVDISVERESDGMPVYQALGVSNAPPNTGIHTGWVPTANDLGQEFRVRITFYNTLTSDVSERVSETPFLVEDILDRQEDVTYPNGHELLFPGDAMTILWTQDDTWRWQDRVLDEVDILLSKDGGQAWEPLVTGLDNIGIYTWTPAITDQSADSRIKVVFHNVVNTQTVEDESDESFIIGGYRLTYENLSADTQLDYDGTPYSSVGLDYDEDGDEDLMISIRDAPSQLYRNAFLATSGAPVFERRTQAAFPVLGDRPQAGLRGLAVADFDEDGAVDVFAACETQARLYHNNAAGGQDTFTDVAGDLGLHTAGAIDGSWTAVWEDFDDNGSLDLFVGRATLPQGASAGDPPDPATLLPATPVLFRNDVGTFVDVTQSVGLDAYDLAALSASWAEVTGDAYPELVIGDFAAGGTSRLYVNNGGTSFTEATGTRIPDLPAAVSGLIWADVDADADLDLAVARQSTQLPTVRVLRNDGTGTFTSYADYGAGMAASGLASFDQDANGLPDLLIVPSSSSEHPLLLSNYSSSQALVFMDRTSAVGLTDAGDVGGVVVHDFDSDRKPDLYLGRPVASGKIYYRSKKTVPGAPEPLSIAIYVEGGGAGNSEEGTGVVVTLLNDGQPVLSQISGGAAGRGSQSALPLLFGLGGDDAGPFTARVHWAEGYVQTTGALQVNQLNVIEDDTDPTIESASMDAGYAPEPGGTATWTFTWDCAYASIVALDKVFVSSQMCLSNPIAFHEGQPNVTVTCTRLTGGGWRHEIVITGRECIPNCQYTWYCESATRFVTSTTSSTPKTFKTKICAQ